MRFLSGIAAVVLTLAGGTLAQAGPHGNRIRIHNSGNGIQNQIIARNQAMPFPAGLPAMPAAYPGGPGFAPPQMPFPTPVAGGLPGYPGQWAPGVGGVNVNVITNSGNGAGNTVFSTNGAQGPGALNINVITNSGNGIGNTIGAFNRYR